MLLYFRRAAIPSRLKYRNSISFQDASESFALRGMPIIVPPQVDVGASPGSKIGSGIIRIFPATAGAYALIWSTFQSGVNSAQTFPSVRSRDNPPAPAGNCEA